MKLVPGFSLFTLLLLNTPVQQNGKVLQFDIRQILNARPVTVLTGKKLVPWSTGIDGNGFGDGYSTLSAAVVNGDKDPHALPDNPLIAANSSHPEIRLNYSDRDSVHNQAYSIAGAGKVEFDIPKAKYKDIYLALTSSEGSSAIQVKLTYTKEDEIKNYTLPDYYLDLAPDDSDFCYLVHDLAKWGNKNTMTEKDHHNIDLLHIHSDPARELKSISISKTKPGYLVLWAAAGARN
jgi:hypothetical protein